jgi:polyisoprenoid-binding protein YceI
MKRSKRWWLAPALCAGFLSVGPAGRPAHAAPEAYQVDPVHSAILFRTKHLNVSHVYGRFDQFSGTITIDEANPAASSVRIEVDAKSLNTGNPKRDDHLRSPDFFGVVQFPKITFASTAVKKDGDVYEVTGDLALHGVTKSVTVKMQQLGKGPGMKPGTTLVGFEGVLEIKRSDYGMNFMLNGVSDDVRLTLAFEAGR